MEFEFKKNKIVFNRELSDLDQLVISFTKILNRQKIDYVIISGYIAILFGKSRQPWLHSDSGEIKKTD